MGFSGGGEGGGGEGGAGFEEAVQGRVEAGGDEVFFRLLGGSVVGPERESGGGKGGEKVRGGGARGKGYI